jgi:hypothetical protein
MQQTEWDPLVITRGFGEFVMEIAPRIPPMMLLIRDAALSDPEIATLQAELEDARLRRTVHSARNFLNAGALRPDLSIEAAGEIGWLQRRPALRPAGHQTWLAARALRGVRRRGAGRRVLPARRRRRGLAAAEEEGDGDALIG